MASFPQPDDKDPGALLDYLLDLAALTNGNGKSDYLQSGETIQSVNDVISSRSELVISSYELINSDTSVKIWLSGGTHATRYTITVKFTTTSGRTDERSFNVRVLDR